MIRWKISCCVAFSLSLNLVIFAQDPMPKTQSFGTQVGADLEQHVAKNGLAVLPLGSIEYHGPSGPPLTDSLIAEGIAGQVASRFQASVFPVLSYTHCPTHTAVFQGSVSVRPEVVTQLMADVLRSLVKNGFKTILLLNAHDGNIGPARMAVSQVTNEYPETQMLFLSWWETLPTPEVESLGLFTSGNGGHGHGGPLELSVASVFAPQAVEAGRAPDRPALLGAADFPYYLEKAAPDQWPGYSGKLSEISRPAGEKLVTIAVDKISRLVAAWLADPKRPGSW